MTNNEIHFILGKQKFFLEQRIKKLVLSCKQQQLDVVCYRIQQDSYTCLQQELQVSSLITSTWRKVIIVDQSQVLLQKKPQEIAFLISYLQNPFKTINLYFFAEKTTYCLETENIFQQYCLCETIEFLEKKDFYSHILKDFKKDGFNIEKKAINVLINKTNYNLYFLHQEIQKLKLCQFNDKNITEQLVQKIIIFHEDNNIFKLINLFLNSHLIDAYEMYQKLKVQKISALHIIYQLTYKIKELLWTQKLTKFNKSQEQISHILKCSIKKVFFLIKESQILSSQKLKKLFLALSLLECKIKTGVINPQTGLELFFLGQSSFLQDIC